MKSALLAQIALAVACTMDQGGNLIASLFDGSIGVLGSFVFAFLLGCFVCVHLGLWCYPKKALFWPYTGILVKLSPSISNIPYRTPINLQVFRIIAMVLISVLVIAAGIFGPPDTKNHFRDTYNLPLPVLVVSVVIFCALMTLWSYFQIWLVCLTTVKMVASNAI